MPDADLEPLIIVGMFAYDQAKKESYILHIVLPADWWNDFL
jgi:hypothetical protein